MLLSHSCAGTTCGVLTTLAGKLFPDSAHNAARRGGKVEILVSARYRTRRCALKPLALALLACAAAMGTDPSTPIATDRPSVTASSIVVPVGSFQDENGFAFTADQGQTTFDAPESLFRLGVATRAELRLTLPDYFDDYLNRGAAGFGDLLIGTKLQLGPTLGGFDVSLILSLSIPTGSRAFSSGGYDPSVQLPWSRSISKNWTAEGMLSVYVPTQNGRRNVTGESTFLLDRQLTKPWDVFAEYVGDFPERGGPRHLIHFGTSYKITPHQQIDVHGGAGLSSAAIDHFIGAGYSFRVQFWHRGS
jgi:Putative MetA-pathway of phenol degradation